MKNISNGKKGILCYLIALLILLINPMLNSGTIFFWVWTIIALILGLFEFNYLIVKEG